MSSGPDMAAALRAEHPDLPHERVLAAGRILDEVVLRTRLTGSVDWDAVDAAIGRARDVMFEASPSEPACEAQP